MPRLPHRASPHRGSVGRRWWGTVASRGFHLHLHLLLILFTPQPPWVSFASAALSLAASVLLARQCSIHSAGLKPQLESPFDQRVRRGTVLSAGEILAPGGQVAQVQPADLCTPYFFSFTGCAFIHALFVRVISEVHSSCFDESFIFFFSSRRRTVSCDLNVNFHFNCTHLMMK